MAGRTRRKLSLKTKIPMILASHSLASNATGGLDEKFLRKLVRMWR